MATKSPKKAKNNGKGKPLKPRKKPKGTEK